ncbi:MAG: hypothetical protein LC772_10900, partial [Chloroflexi bacterium]|nr:hypothetical protein [Chloroflexota bacterium]
IVALTSAPRVDSAEIARMLERSPLVHDPQQLHIDYGDQAQEMTDALAAGGPDLLPLLACPGIATRWRSLLDWAAVRAAGTLKERFTAFAEHLGRLTTYRALALTDDEYWQICSADTLTPTGRLKADSSPVLEYLRGEGIRKILDRRLRDMSALRLDPSMSLHDHPETAVCVAEGYMRPPERKIYRFELDLPVIETLGWRIRDVNGQKDWFLHRGIWFDPSNPRTERFALLEIPFFNARCKSLRTFDSAIEVGDYLMPFAEEQAVRKARSLRSQSPDGPSF